MRLPVWKRKEMMAEARPADATKSRGEARSSAFCELFDTYQPALRRLVAAYVANSADREELLQDIAVGIWKSLPTFRGDASERTWIYRIAHNIAIRSSSQVHKRNAREPQMDVSLDHPFGGSNAEDALLVAERQTVLMNAIRELAVLDKQLVTLHLEGLSAAEIEEITGLSQGAIATRLTRIRQTIVKRVRADGMRHERPDDLEQLWRTQPVLPAVKGEEMRDIVLKKIKAFDRTIRVRNRIESGAALVVAVFFAYAALTQHNGIERLGSAIVVAGALWIIFYIRRHGTDPGDPSLDQTVAMYRRALILKYEHQIRLLRNVKFWYLLPMYIGLLTGSVGVLQEEARTRQLTWADGVPPLVYTLIFAVVWWLNEVYSVRKLQRMCTQVPSGVDEDEQC